MKNIYRVAGFVFVLAVLTEWKENFPIYFAAAVGIVCIIIAIFRAMSWIMRGVFFTFGALMVLGVFIGMVFIVIGVVYGIAVTIRMLVRHAS
ncbi:hypothetical protein MK805_02630 [Shimazuella sp. AN120528]|uniref:hypothetical protein n=1 Tax=Shimazuella soli TaxID=1892854 RepID=UPI001F0F5F4C|nr:hypothetical protein [Shimazuella soli]MCH5583863.1 hypothetical protein [Shimazuella soli]